MLSTPVYIILYHSSVSAMILNEVPLVNVVTISEFVEACFLILA